MKSFLFSLALLFFCSCTKNLQCSKDDLYFQKLSSEIENSEEDPEFYVSSEKENQVAEETKVILAEKIESIDRSISNINYFYAPDPKKEKTQHYTKKNIAVKNFYKDAPGIDIDKDNIFWKIGQGLSSVGLLLLGIFGGISLSFNSNNGGIFFFAGAMIGLAVLLLSLPFFLLGIITGNMKKNPAPPKDADEI